jgi:LacI family transcriptional regulator
MNSRGGLVADSIRRLGLRDISLISFDLTEDNRRCLEEGSITALLCQRPAYQGFSAIKGLISHLLYRKGLKEETVPCDIVLKENLPLYREILDD